MEHLLRFADGVMVEIAQNPDKAVAVSGKAAERLSEAFQSAADVAGTALRAVVTSLTRAVRDSGAGDAEVEFGVGFAIEGNLYITKVAGEGNIQIKVKINGAPR